MTASAVVLATGGLSLPKTGSDGSGYAFAQALGHTIVAPLPALAPLVLDENDPHAVNGDLSGVSQTVEIAIWIDGSHLAEVVRIPSLDAFRRERAGRPERLTPLGPGAARGP